MSDAALAAALAEAAGRLLLDLRAGGGSGAEGDAAANRLILDCLAAERPGDGILSEESRDTAERLGKARVWIVDPLDGTREFAEGRADWAVHVGLAIGGVAEAGAVALPALGEVWRSDDLAPLPSSNDTPRIIVSRSRPPAEAQTVADALGGDLVPLGSAGAKAMAVLRGEAEVYLHSGGQYEWDSCAPVAVALAHGLHASRLDGTALAYNRPDSYLPDLLICRPEWADRVLAVLAER